jgi:hypothetical protein
MKNRREQPRSMEPQPKTIQHPTAPSSRKGKERKRKGKAKTPKPVATESSLCNCILPEQQRYRGHPRIFSESRQLTITPRASQERRFVQEASKTLVRNKILYPAKISVKGAATTDIFKHPRIYKICFPHLFWEGNVLWQHKTSAGLGQLRPKP